MAQLAWTADSQEPDHLPVLESPAFSAAVIGLVDSLYRLQRVPIDPLSLHCPAHERLEGAYDVVQGPRSRAAGLTIPQVLGQAVTIHIPQFGPAAGFPDGCEASLSIVDVDLIAAERFEFSPVIRDMLAPGGPTLLGQLRHEPQDLKASSRNVLQSLWFWWLPSVHAVTGIL
jgi:hypothetical protein